ncbi:alanine racemase [Phormidium yuhuli AB48]|uniref:Alanine racemase n=1 Tax=Phormidium yuhuli AB48 TaxID=2940671 RepID=A0ABY5ALT1_9CYAN|nr:alanine racemase [Phormidium yuhuli]USR89706.1 alanine racemase [Phormidium yuhuli AB48]
MLTWERIVKFSQDQTHPGVCDRAWVEIDLGALGENVRQLRGLLAPETDLMAVVKADGYGHGAIPIAKTVLEAGARALGVATVPEGIELRQAGIEAPILVLGAVQSPPQIEALVRWRLEPTLCDRPQAVLMAKILDQLAPDQPLPVHLKLDTGMSRLGVLWTEAVPFVRQVLAFPQLRLASVYSHLATADEEDITMMRTQEERFQGAIAALKSAGITPPKLHLANSAATLCNRASHYDQVRVGLSLYGLYPAPHLRSQVKLQPVLQVKARITQVKTIPPGTGVSYGHRFVSQRETRLAVVGIGYADGVPRLLSNRLQGLWQGGDRVWRFPQVGAITMDQLMLDVTEVPEVQVGDVVTFLGTLGDTSISADDWAEALGTISWEILCGFKHRLPRIQV